MSSFLVKNVEYILIRSIAMLCLSGRCLPFHHQDNRAVANHWRGLRSDNKKQFMFYLQSWARVISFRHGCPSSGINTDAVDPFPVLGREEVLCRADEKIQMGDNYHT